jgi:hypothetical protein
MVFFHIFPHFSHLFQPFPTGKNNNDATGALFEAEREAAEKAALQAELERAVKEDEKKKRRNLRPWDRNTLWLPSGKLT